MTGNRHLPDKLSFLYLFTYDMPSTQIYIRIAWRHVVDTGLSRRTYVGVAKRHIFEKNAGLVEHWPRCSQSLLSLFWQDGEVLLLSQVLLSQVLL